MSSQCSSEVEGQVCVTPGGKRSATPTAAGQTDRQTARPESKAAS